VPNPKDEILNAIAPGNAAKKEILGALSPRVQRPALTPAPEPTSPAQSFWSQFANTAIENSPLGVGKHLVEAFQRGDELNNAKNAAVNTFVSGGSLRQSLDAANKTAQTKQEVPLNAFRQLTNEKSGTLARTATKVADVLTEGMTDPTNIVLGPLTEGAGMVVRAGLKYGKELPIALRAAERMNRIVNPIKTLYANSGLKNTAELVMDAFGQGPLRGVNREITGPYRTIINNIGSDLAGVFRRIETATQEHPNLPAIEDWSSQHAGANPMVELVRRRILDLGSSKSLQGAKPGTGWQAIVDDAKTLGIDPLEVENYAKEIFHHYNSAEYTIAKLKPERVHPSTADARIKRFTDEIFGKESVPNGPLQSGVLSNRPMQASMVHEAGLRQLMDILPGSNWAVPAAQAPKGWSVIENRGPLAPLAGMAMPYNLKTFLESETAAAKLRGSGEVKNMYTKTFDVLMALDKKALGQVKKGWLSLPSTQIANATSNTFAASIPLQKNGLSAVKDLLPNLPKAMARVRNWENKGVQDAAIQRFNQYSNALHATQASVNIPQGGKVENYLPHSWGMLTQNVVEKAYKLALFEALEPKLGSKAAAATVDKYLFDYSDRGVVLEILDRFGVWPFSTFGIKATGLLFNTIVNHPEMVARLPRYHYLATREDEPANNPRIPEWAQRSPFTIPVGQGGQHEYVNLSRLHTFGGTIDMLSDLWKGTNIPRELGNMVDKPMAAGMYNVLKGRKVYTRDERSNPSVLEKGQPPGQLGREMLKEGVKEFAPGGRAMIAAGEAQRGVKDSAGVPKTMGDVLLQYGLGIKPIREMDDAHVRMQLQSLKKELIAAKFRLGRLQREKSGKRDLEEQRQYITDLQKQMQGMRE
jgi:hypothetical protein